jgi:hypothetical protein
VSDEQYRADAETSNKGNNNKPCNGVKGLWCFSVLEYAKVDENIGFDGFHVLLNVADYTINSLLGKRLIDTGTREFCKNTHSHPNLWRGSNITTDEGPWVLSAQALLVSHSKNKKIKKSDKKSIIVSNLTDYLNAICFPSGLDENFRVQDFISSLGDFKGTFHVTCLFTYTEE